MILTTLSAKYEIKFRGEHLTAFTCMSSGLFAAMPLSFVSMLISWRTYGCTDKVATIFANACLIVASLCFCASLFAMPFAYGVLDVLMRQGYL